MILPYSSAQFSAQTQFSLLAGTASGVTNTRCSCACAARFCESWEM